MIDEEETFKRFGYRSTDWAPKSSKRIVVVCDECGKVRETSKQGYRSLCNSCIKKIYWKDPINCKHQSERRKKYFENSENRVKVSEQSKRYWENQNQEIHKIQSEKSKEYLKKFENRKIHSKAVIKGLKKYCKNNQKYCISCGNKFIPTGIQQIYCKKCKPGKYCYLFNLKFKQKIRSENNYICFLCGRTEKENKEAHCVHHVNYDKNCMCGSSCDFVILCRSCHSKTNGKYKNRKYWEDVIINHLYPNKYFMTDI